MMKFLYSLLLLLPMAFLSVGTANADQNPNTAELTQFRNNAMDVLDGSNCRARFREYLQEETPKAFIYVAKEGQISVYCYAIEGHTIKICHNKRKPNTPCLFFARDNDLLLSRDDLELEPIENNLIHAAERYGVDEVKELIKAGVDINQKNERGNTALFTAVIEKKLEVLKYLASAGADLELKNAQGDNALIMATERKYKDIVAYLLSQGADITVTSTVKMQPVHIAATDKKIEILNMIVSKGADINAKDVKGRTPLDWATYYRHKETMDYLVKNGAKLGNSF